MKIIFVANSMTLTSTTVWTAWIPS